MTLTMGWIGPLSTPFRALFQFGVLLVVDVILNNVLAHVAKCTHVVAG